MPLCHGGMRRLFRSASAAASTSLSPHERPECSGSVLGVETRRQWSDLAILRTTPALLGLFSLVTLLVHRLLQGKDLPTRQAAWYQKASPSFSDALAFLRLQLWPARVIWRSPGQTDIVEIPRGLLDCLTDMLAYAT